jgi:hypothetical protein
VVVTCHTVSLSHVSSLCAEKTVETVMLEAHRACYTKVLLLKCLSVLEVFYIRFWRGYVLGVC